MTFNETLNTLAKLYPNEFIFFIAGVRDSALDRERERVREAIEKLTLHPFAGDDYGLIIASQLKKELGL